MAAYGFASNPPHGLPLGDDIGFIRGHGAGSSFGQERMTNPSLTGEM
jgi:hydroxyacylglutathione hydrolase